MSLQCYSKPFTVTFRETGYAKYLVDLEGHLLFSLKWMLVCQNINWEG